MPLTLWISFGWVGKLILRLVYRIGANTTVLISSTKLSPRSLAFVSLQIMHLIPPSVNSSFRLFIMEQLNRLLHRSWFVPSTHSILDLTIPSRRKATALWASFHLTTDINTAFFQIHDPFLDSHPSCEANSRRGRVFEGTSAFACAKHTLRVVSQKSLKRRMLVVSRYCGR